MMSDPRPPICDYEGSDYQESFWDRGERAYEDRVEAIALKRLLPKGGRRLLEIGAGAGRNTPRYTGFEQIVLLDYSWTQLEQARDRLGLTNRFLYVAADVYRPPFCRDVFDAATMIRTLHHLVDPQQALSKIRYSLAPGATFVLEFANKRNIKSILRWLLKRQNWNPFDPEQIEFAELNFNFHPRVIRQILYEEGYSIDRALTVSHFRIEILKRMFPLAVLVAADSWIQWTGGLWQLTPSVFLKLGVGGQAGEGLGSEVFCCPACDGGSLKEDAGGMRCLRCGSYWEVRQGIHDFRDPSKD
jgi:ubiquinone/menaquinone biosynthesis C-methylase UbiE